jgi:hypothetical protein
MKTKPKHQKDFWFRSLPKPVLPAFMKNPAFAGFFVFCLRQLKVKSIHHGDTEARRKD